MTSWTATTESGTRYDFAVDPTTQLLGFIRQEPDSFNASECVVLDHTLPRLGERLSIQVVPDYPGGPSYLTTSPVAALSGAVPQL